MGPQRAGLPGSLSLCPHPATYPRRYQSVSGLTRLPPPLLRQGPCPPSTPPLRTQDQTTPSTSELLQEENQTTRNHAEDKPGWHEAYLLAPRLRNHPIIVHQGGFTGCRVPVDVQGDSPAAAWRQSIPQRSRARASPSPHQQSLTHLPTRRFPP